MDHLGTPLELLDTEGSTVWSAKYMAWGRVWQLGADEVAQPLRFQGQYFDQESGLHYNRFRYYDPQIGRFIGQDPIGLFGGENLYQYGPNPVGWIDPFGLAGVPVPTPTGKGAGGLIKGADLPNGGDTGLSTRAGGPGIHNPAVQAAYDETPKDQRSFYHGKCCEGDCLSKIANNAGVT